MIIKGSSRRGPAALAKHVQRTDTNERAIIREARGTLSQDVDGALQEMAAIAAGSKCKNFLYHANLNPRADEHLTPDQWQQSVDALERNLGLVNHQRVVIEHVKEGRQHFHVIWNRVDVETMKAVHMGNDYAIHQETARALEQAFQLDPVQSVFHRPANTPRQERTPKQWEIERGKESGMDPRDIKSEVTELWHSCGTGREFAAALTEKGYILAKGDRRDFVLIDAAGNYHSLARRIAGAKAADVREKMGDIDRDRLPNVEQAQAAQREGVAYHYTPQPPKDRTSVEIYNAYQAATTGQEFVNALPSKSLLLAKADRDDVLILEKSRGEAKNAGHKELPPAIKEGELVIINKNGSIYKINERTTGSTRDDIKSKLETFDSQHVPTVKNALAQTRFIESLKGVSQEIEREEKRERQLPAANENKATAQGKAPAGRSIESGAAKGADAVARVITKGAEKAVDTIATLVEGLLTMGDPAPPRITPAEYMANVEARKEYAEQQAREAGRQKALEQIKEDQEKGRHINPDNISSLSREDLETLKSKGIDDGLRALIDQLEKEQERKRAFQRYRER